MMKIIQKIGAKRIAVVLVLFVVAFLSINVFSKAASNPENHTKTIESLDEKKADVLKLIRELAKENYTILVVTHNMAFARDVSDEVVFVDKGEILAHGSYDELTQLENERIKQFLSFFKD